MCLNGWVDPLWTTSGIPLDPLWTPSGPPLDPLGTPSDERDQGHAPFVPPRVTQQVDGTPLYPSVPPLEPLRTSSGTPLDPLSRA
jgi:hypothetical protein